MSAEITVEEIKGIRNKYGLSQQAFARLLGLGETSIVRYENGQVPSKANANLIRAANHPSFVAECLEQESINISADQRENLEKIVYAMVTFDDRGYAMEVNELYTLTLEQEVLNEKAANLLAEVSRMLFEAETNNDEVGKILYSDVLTLLAQAKGRIVREVNGSEKKLAEIKGAIDCLEQVVQLKARKVA